MNFTSFDWPCLLEYVRQNGQPAIQPFGLWTERSERAITMSTTSYSQSPSCWFEPLLLFHGNMPWSFPMTSCSELPLCNTCFHGAPYVSALHDIMQCDYGESFGSNAFIA